MARKSSEPGSPTFPLQVSQATDDTEILEAQKNRWLARVQGPENFEIEGEINVIFCHGTSCFWIWDQIR